MARTLSDVQEGYKNIKKFVICTRMLLKLQTTYVDERYKKCQETCSILKNYVRISTL